jgi:hypothetical protein
MRWRRQRGDSDRWQAKVGPLVLYVFRTSSIHKAEAYFQVEIRQTPGGPNSEALFRSSGMAKPFEEAKALAVKEARGVFEGWSQMIDLMLQHEDDLRRRRRKRTFGFDPRSS